MPRPRIYQTAEALAEAKRRWSAKTKARPEAKARRRELERSAATKARKVAYNVMPEARALAKERYARYRETDKYRETQRRYRDAKGKKTGKNYLANARSETPERIKARAAVATLLRRGDIVKPATCSTCGALGPVDAHHHMGYALEQWLTVQWLCRRCHKAAHS